MPVNRKLWKATFTEHDAPLWPCPECSEGRLLLEKKSIQELESSDSKKARSNDAWDPDWIEGEFIAYLKCNIPSCNCIAGVIGHYTVEETYPEYGYESRYRPVFFRPSPPVFRIPEDCPESVSVEVRASFGLVLADPLASANRIRASLEALMDYVKVPRWTGRGKGKRNSLSLHKRIEKYGVKAKDKNLQVMLTAVKWIGNEGSHGGTMTIDDLLVGFELLEYILVLIFEDQAAKLLAISKKINKKKGPLSKRSRKSK